MAQIGVVAVVDEALVDAGGARRRTRRRPTRRRRRRWRCTGRSRRRAGRRRCRRTRRSPGRSRSASRRREHAVAVALPAPSTSIGAVERDDGAQRATRGGRDVVAGRGQQLGDLGLHGRRGRQRLGEGGDDGTSSPMTARARRRRRVGAGRHRDVGAVGGVVGSAWCGRHGGRGRGGGVVGAAWPGSSRRPGRGSPSSVTSPWRRRWSSGKRPSARSTAAPRRRPRRPRPRRRPETIREDADDDQRAPVAVGRRTVRPAVVLGCCGSDVPPASSTEPPRAAPWRS